MLLKIAGAVVLLLAAASYVADAVDVCSCADVDACKEKMSSALFPCLEECKPKVTEAGADFDAFHKCLEPFKGKFKATLTCIERHLNGSCAPENTPMSPDLSAKLAKLGTLENEAQLEFAEVIVAIKQLGIEAKAPKGQELHTCMRSCMQSKSGHCAKSLQCTLFAPTEEDLGEVGKKCAEESGITEASLKGMCECMAGAKGK